MRSSFSQLTMPLMMHTYLHLIHSAHSEDYSDIEEQRLRDCVSSAPGVVEVTDISKHSRGGYSVSFNGSTELFDSMIAHFSAAGYTPVL
jgi:hypothetical protein